MPVGLIALCFGNFVIGTGMLVVPGMLPALADGLGVTLPVAGQLVTAFAFTVCIGAPLLAAATSRFDRRKLLASVQLLYVAGQLAAAMVSDFLPMLSVRVVTALAAALFTAQAAATAALIVPPDKRGGAIAFVVIGWAIAAIVGLPLGAYVSATLGWRAGFLLVAGGAVAGTALVWICVPAGLRVPPADARMWRDILGNRVLLSVLAVTALQSTSQFAIFAYMVPAASAFLQFAPAQLGLILAGFGCVGVAGNVLAVRFIDRAGAGNVALAAFASMTVAHLLWPLSPGSIPFLLAVLALWGLGTFAANSAQQARLAALAPHQASVSVALNSSAIHLGGAVGPAIGGLVLAYVPGVAGYQALAWVSVPLFLAAIALLLMAGRAAHPGDAQDGGGV